MAWRQIVLIALLVAQVTLSDIHVSPADSPCAACDTKCKWVHITIPTGNFKATVGDQAQLVEAGYDGLYSSDTLTMRVVFTMTQRRIRHGRWPMCARNGCAMIRTVRVFSTRRKM